MSVSLTSWVTIDRLFAPVRRLVQFAIRPITFLSTENSGDVVVMKFFGLGSIIRMLSLSEERGVDLSRVVIVTFAANAELCRVWGVRAIFIRNNSLLEMFLTSMAAIRDVRSMKPRLCVDFERGSHLVAIFRTLVSWRAGCKAIGFEMRAHNSKTASVYAIGGMSQIDIFLTGIKEFPVGGIKRMSAWTDVARGKAIININASTLLPERKYGLDAFARVIERLISRRGDLVVYLTGSVDERYYVQQLANRFDARRVVNVAGKWTLALLIAELADCELFITCDSAPLHLAASMNVPTLALWGPTQPDHFGYKDTRTMHTLSLRLKCSPCFVHPRSTPAIACKGAITCMRDLSPDVVETKASEIMETLPSSREVIFPSNYVPLAAHALS
jgi:hypothetical protein